jgi:hypothetical protein
MEEKDTGIFVPDVAEAHTWWSMWAVAALAAFDGWQAFLASEAAKFPPEVILYTHLAAAVIIPILRVLNQK